MAMVHCMLKIDGSEIQKIFLEENFVVFAAPPSVIVPLLVLDKLGFTQARVCNEVDSST